MQHALEARRLIRSLRGLSLLLHDDAAYGVDPLAEVRWSIQTKNKNGLGTLASTAEQARGPSGLGQWGEWRATCVSPCHIPHRLVPSNNMSDKDGSVRSQHLKDVNHALGSLAAARNPAWDMRLD